MKFLLFVLATLLLVGCGGSRGASSLNAKGRATLKVLWPARGRMIPNAANSLVVTVTKGGATVDSKLIARPGAGETQTETSFTGLSVGTYNLAIEAFPNADGTGTVQAQGSGTMTTGLDAPGAATISLDSTVTQLEVSPATASIAVGGNVQFTATAKDSNGNIVLLAAGGGAETIAWESDSTFCASVSGTGQTGTVTGLNASLSIIKAKFITDDAGTVVSGTAVVTVTSGTSAVGNYYWDYQTGGIVYSGVAVASDGTVYFGSYDHNVYALNPDGTLKWSYMTGGTVVCPPLVGPDGTIYVGSNDRNLYALNADGTLKWSYLFSNTVTLMPALDALGNVYVSNGTYLHALAPDGTLLWSYFAGSTIQSAPRVTADGTVYYGCANGQLQSLDSAGSLRWTFSTGSSVKSTPVILSDGNLCFGSNDFFLYCIAPSDGSLVWSIHLDSQVPNAPIANSSDTVYITTNTGTLYAISSGNVQWSYPSSGQSLTRAALAADGSVYFGNNLGEFYAINSDGTLKWTATSGGSIRGPIAVATDGTVYFGSSNGRVYSYQ